MEPTAATTDATATVLKELSDIKASLAVNTSETANIKGNITDIKTDMREIKNDFVNRRELNDALIVIRKTEEDNKVSTDKLLATHSKEIESLIGTRNKTIGALLVLQLAWALALFFANKYF